LNDVHGCWGLLVKLNYDERVDSYRNKLGYLEKYGPPKWVPEYADSFPQTNKYEPKASNK
jgi:DNA polymerase-3 subunit epsilon